MTKTSSIGHQPNGSKWEFDASVTDVFDDMLERSIPQYSVMREAVYELAIRYAQIGTAVVDLGCARGGAIAQLVEKLGSANRFVGVETSAPMLSACRERFKEEIAEGYVVVLDLDLRTEYPSTFASVTLCVLTLQFTPIEHRMQIVHNIYKNTQPGGVLLLVEKVLGNAAELDQAFVETYYDHKKRNGYSNDEIERKRLSLEGVLVPVTAAWNEELLRSAGFARVDCFWRWMNFAGWVALKP